MNKRYLMTAVSAAICTATLCAADGERVFDGGWRLTAGAIWNSPVKTRMRFTPSSLRPASRVTTGTGLSETAAKALAEGGTYDPTTGRTTYPNGGWFAPDDGVDGANKTWNGHLPSGAYRGDRTFSLGEVEYGGTVSEYSPDGIPGHYDSDSSSMPGIDIGLSRELYRNEEYGYGLDLAFDVMYFLRNDAFKSGYGYRAGRESESQDGGTYEGTIDAPDELPNSEDWYWNDDGSYGRGGLDTGYNGGPVFDLGSIKSVNHPGAGSSSSVRDCPGAIRARGDYRQLDLMLSVRPYYDVADWLRLYGTLGAVVSRNEFDLKVTMSDNGLGYRHRRDYSQWNIYGIGGLGAMLRYRDFTLAGDFLARFGDDVLRVDDRYVHGKIEQGNWMFKLTLGYEF